jgi:hypothetical protein
VRAFVDAANGRVRTLTFVVTENGRSICGGYLDVAWVKDGYAKDPGRRSFIFTLRNHLGVAPTKFAQRRDECAAYMNCPDGVYFGHYEGFRVCRSYCKLDSGQTYEAPGGGVATFTGDEHPWFPCGPVGAVAGRLILPWGY